MNIDEILQTIHRCLIEKIILRETISYFNS